MKNMLSRVTWEVLKESWSKIFLIIITSWILFHLILIQLYNAVEIIEPNGWWLKIEIIMFIAIFVLSIERLINYLKEFSSKEKKT